MADSIPKPLKCMIKNLDTQEEVEAHFNPKELSVGYVRGYGYFEGSERA